MTIGADENLPTLWQHFMLRHGELPDRHPVELFGEAVVNRIFAGAEDWHWRRLAPPALIGLALVTAPLSAILAQMQGAILYSWFCRRTHSACFSGSGSPLARSPWVIGTDAAVLREN